MTSKFVIHKRFPTVRMTVGKAFGFQILLKLGVYGEKQEASFHQCSSCNRFHNAAKLFDLKLLARLGAKQALRFRPSFSLVHAPLVQPKSLKHRG